LDIKKECYKLYCDEFGEDEFSIRLFDKCFKYCKWYEVNGKPVSILFLFPCRIEIQNNIYNAKYIFAVTTDKEYRNRGYMKKMLSELDIKEILFLKPSSDSLIDYYNKLGFKVFNATEKRVGDKKVVLSDDFYNFAKDYEVNSKFSYKAMYKFSKEINLNNLYFPYTME